jgi:hypothetical protein
MKEHGAFSEGLNPGQIRVRIKDIKKVDHTGGWMVVTHHEL